MISVDAFKKGDYAYQVINNTIHYYILDVPPSKHGLYSAIDITYNCIYIGRSKVLCNDSLRFANAKEQNFINQVLFDHGMVYDPFNNKLRKKKGIIQRGKKYCPFISKRGIEGYVCNYYCNDGNRRGHKCIGCDDIFQFVGLNKLFTN